MTGRNVALRGMGSISALGYGREAVWRTYEQGRPHFRVLDDGTAVYPVAPAVLERVLPPLIAELPRLAELDRVVQLACLAAREAVADAREQCSFDVQSARRVAVLIGTARGATATWESSLEAWHTTQAVPVMTSPQTTFGIVSSTVAQLLKANGIAVDVSMTCTSGLHALMLGRSLLLSDEVDAVVVGGAEAALTPYTLSQLRALRLTPPWEGGSDPPCRPLDASPAARARLVLGEGACIAVLTQTTAATRGCCEIHPLGFSAEVPPSLTGISPEGIVLRRSMEDALERGLVPADRVDLVAPHAPGTGKGDNAELKALASLFGNIPPLVTTKFLTGHTYAASGMLGLELVRLVMAGLRPARPDYATRGPMYEPGAPPRVALINAAGFGGNAVSCLVSQSGGGAP